MSLLLLESIRHANPNNTYCEDLCGKVGDIAWLLDGATPIEAGRIHPLSDALWLVECFDDEIRREYASG